MVTIRRAAPADAPILAQLLAQLGYAATVEEIPARLAAVTEEGGVALVAVDETGRVCGAASGARHSTLHGVQPTAFITALVTDEAHRRRGVGRHLVAALVLWAREVGCHRLSVTSAEHRADAHAFYPRCGLPYSGRRFTKDLRAAVP